MRSITPTEIEQLYAFTIKHYVEFYDLQSELVDHLANGIENQWQENPKLDFEEALQIEFKKFGIFGFTDIQEQRKQALHKRYHKIIWSLFKDFFRLPKIIATVLSVYLVYLGLRLFNSYDIVLMTFFFSSSVLVLCFVIFKSIQRKKRRKAGERVFIFNEVIHGYGINSWMFVVPIHVSNMFHDSLESTSMFAALCWSIFIVMMFLYHYIVLVEIPKKANVYLKEVYPEYELMQKA